MRETPWRREKIQSLIEGVPRSSPLIQIYAHEIDICIYTVLRDRRSKRIETSRSQLELQEEEDEHILFLPLHFKEDTNDEKDTYRVKKKEV